MGAIAATGLFQAPEYRTFEWDLRYTTAEWLDLLPTHSDHALLPADQLRALLDGIGAAIDARGGAIDVRYTTHLIAAVRV